MSKVQPCAVTLREQESHGSGQSTPRGSTEAEINYMNSRRDPILKSLQAIVKQVADQHGGALESPTFVTLFSRQDVLALLFKLFDYDGQGKIQQDVFFAALREKMKNEEGFAFVDLMETVSYVITGNEDLDQTSFNRVLASQNVLRKLFRLIIDGRGCSVTTEALMNYVLDLTFIRKEGGLKPCELQCVENMIRTHIKDADKISLEQFKRIMPSKNAFFTERAYQLFDKDGSGSVSVKEFMQSIEQYCGQSPDGKAHFIFQMYDIDGDGLIPIHELKSVLRACMEESGMKFSEEQLTQLTEALYEDANPEGSPGITFEQLKTQFQKHDGLLDSLSINIERWLLTAICQNKAKQVTIIPSKWSMNYIKNNIVFIAFLTCYVVLNILLICGRASMFYDFTVGEPEIRVQEDYLYMLARGSGTALHFNSMFVLVLMLRRSITFLRGQGFAKVLPLDQHVYLHKLVGTVIVGLVIFHTIMHVSHFIFIVGDVWPIHNKTYTAAEWLFTTKPKTFGVIHGTANLTGWAMLVIVLVLALCSLPCVRRRGNFEVFYWTHLLCFPFWALLILHEEHFWRWLVVPGTIYLIELSVRLFQRLTGHGRTYIGSVALLPSRVTHLVVKKPRHFDFQPGDYVFVNVPAIASAEWHPFTISSAPEQSDTLSLHIRGVGGWTNRLFDYFDKRQAKLTSVRVNGQLDQTESEKKSTTSLLEVPQPKTVCKNNSCPASQVTQAEKEVRRLSSNPVHVARSSYRFHRNQPVIITCQVPSEEIADRKLKAHKSLTPRASYAPETIKQGPVLETVVIGSNTSEPVDIPKPLKIIIDGPYGAPSSHIFHAEHAVLIAAGIGVTPFASILQSIMHRYWNSKQSCPNCSYTWNLCIPDSIRNLKKVDFFWINREQRSFEWFVDLLTQLEIEQAEKGGLMDRFLDMHMYITSGLQRTDVKAVGLHLALDLLYNKEKRDLITGLKTRTKAGRPNWDKVFQQLQDQHKGKITVFYCGPPQLGAELSTRCVQFGFQFRKEIF